jgi:UDP-N-acetylmuramoylalanine--D-glutamate ligase
MKWGNEMSYINSKLQDYKTYLHNKKIAVLGIGISNTPLIKFLVENNASVTAFDKKSIEQLEGTYEILKSIGVDFCLGSDYLSKLKDFDIVFKTPGMRFDLPELIYARNNGSIITSEMEVFFELCPAKIIAITGSDGKTTTTTLIYKILQEKGYTCWLGGNIGTPLLSEIEKIMPEHMVVLELSSFQLHTMTKSPDIAVITNVSPNHLDIHKSYEEYIDAKKNIMRFQNSDGILVTNFDNSITKEIGENAKGKNIYFSRVNNLDKGACIDNNYFIFKDKDGTHKISDVNDMILPGEHNKENMLAAICAVYDLCGSEPIVKIANTFNGVEHRIELVRVINGVKFYNDSIASSPTRTIAGLNSFKQRVILIAGGYDKKIPYDELGESIIHQVKKLILLGQTADKIYESYKVACDKNKDIQKIEVIFAKTLEEAVEKAYYKAEKGDIITLSPASASFDMFKNFEERGRMYKDIVNKL